MARASGALIWAISHCRPDSESSPGAGVPASITASAESTAEAAGSNLTPIPIVEAAPWTRASEVMLVLNAELSERATTTPI
jgi:hypothetical protein